LELGAGVGAADGDADGFADGEADGDSVGALVDFFDFLELAEPFPFDSGILGPDFFDFFGFFGGAVRATVGAAEGASEG
jgi:hypothetical protein